MAISRILKEFNVFFRLAFCWLVVSSTNLAFGQQLDWQLARESATIKVYQAEALDSNFAHIRAQLIVKSTLSGFLLFLQDFQQISSWLDNANKSELIEQITPTRNLFITHFNGIWPVKARNMVIETEYVQQPNLGIDIYVQDASEKYPEVDKSIRVLVKQAHWHIIPGDELGKIRVNYQFQVDAKGAVPSWLVNQMTVTSVWQTMSNIESMLPSSHWQNFSLSHIKEPSPTDTDTDN